MDAPPSFRAELYFLVAKLLENGPCQSAAQTLRKGKIKYLFTNHQLFVYNQNFSTFCYYFFPIKFQSLNRMKLFRPDMIGKVKDIKRLSRIWKMNLENQQTNTSWTNVLSFVPGLIQVWIFEIKVPKIGFTKFLKSTVFHTYYFFQGPLMSGPYSKRRVQLLPKRLIFFKDWQIFRLVSPTIPINLNGILNWPKTWNCYEELLDIYHRSTV